MFGKFQKLSAQPTGDESSRGLGLSIVKEYTELNGGTISAKSTENEGSTFTITLPLKNGN